MKKLYPHFDVISCVVLHNVFIYSIVKDYYYCAHIKFARLVGWAI